MRLEGYFHMKTFHLIRVAVPVSVAALSSLSMGQFFDFETQAGTESPVGALTSLSMTDAGLTMTIKRLGGTAFDIVDNVSSQAGKPASWGKRSLTPFIDATGGAFVCDFSLGINFFTVEAGDYGADSDDITLEAWTGLGGTGTLIATASPTYGTSAFPTVATGGGTIPGTALSIVMRGGSTAFPASLFWDNIHATAVPEPASFAVLGIGAVALLRRRKRK
jgi:PEP-CTERM motif